MESRGVLRQKASTRREVRTNPEPSKHDRKITLVAGALSGPTHTTDMNYALAMQQAQNATHRSLRRSSFRCNCAKVSKVIASTDRETYG